MNKTNVFGGIASFIIGMVGLFGEIQEIGTESFNNLVIYIMLGFIIAGILLFINGFTKNK